MRASGVLLLDNNVVEHLTDANYRSSFEASLRVADLTFLPTEINFLESVAAPAHVRTKLLAVLKDYVDLNGILPWTYSLLREVGTAHLEGHREFTLDLLSWNSSLDEQGYEEMRSNCLAFAQEQNESLQSRHAKARPRVQRYLKERGLRDNWPDLGAFLSEYWDRADFREHLASGIWKGVGLPYPIPADLLQTNETWRLMLDAEAVSVFQRGLSFQQPKQVQRMDLLQLPYLAAAQRRILLTRDGPFLEAATMVLYRRYSNARVMTPEQFFAEQAG